MSILSNILGAGVREKRETTGFEVLVQLLREAKETTGGVSVTNESALTYSAVFACARILAETVGSLPLILYKRNGRYRERARDHYLYSILHDAPNQLMTAIEFRETLQGYLALWGNALSQIEYDDYGRVRELWPLRWEKVHQIRTETATGMIYYYYQLPDNTFQWLNSDNVWHLRGWGSDGFVGYNPIALARRTIGLGIAAEEFGSRFFSNDARPGIVLEHPGRVGAEAQKNLSESWSEAHQGVSRSHRVAILEEGMKLHEIGIPPEDAQFLETRKFQVTDIARWFRIPPHMLADLDRATFSNIEHLGIEFVMHTLRPWLVRWEQSIQSRLLLPSEREDYYSEYLVEGLLRGDTTTRYQAYAVARQNGWMSANDIREAENMNPVEGGDVYLIPLNMVPATSGGSGEEDNDDRSEKRALNERTLRSVNGRRRAMVAHREVMEELMRRLYRREINDIRPVAARLLPAGMAAEFSSWLEKFYQDHRTWTATQALKTFRAYMRLAAGEAGEEIGRPLEEERLEGFVKSYTQSFADRQAAYSEERVRALLDEEDALDALEEEFGNWQEIRPGRSAGNEIVQQINSVSKLVYIAAGVQSLRWVSSGESCPYCDSLDGMTVGINQSFIMKGETWQPEGAESALVPSVDVGHPPAHEGCDCMVAAG